MNLEMEAAADQAVRFRCQVLLAFDPGPGGLASALTYSGLGNPPSLVAGDVLVFEPGIGNTLSDVIRFNPANTGGSPT